MSDFTEGAERARWNHHPGQVALNPLFQWPPRPMAILRWYASFWLVLSSTTLGLALAAVMLWLWFPDPRAALTGQGALAIWLGLLVPQIVVAGGLHHYLYRRKGQGMALKYEKRDLAHDNGTYTFRSQVKDNMFWTLASGITIGTLYLVAWFWLAGRGAVPMISFAENPVWFCVLLILVPIWGSFHFYWVHRWMHWPPLYKLAHALHHRNVNVGPWSGISMHPVEHVIYFSSFLLFFVIPLHPVHVIFHAYLYTLHPVFSHSGFDGLVTGGKKRAEMGDFFHQLHHRYFECNYGTVEMPWDRWFGTYHDGSGAATEKTRAFKKQMYT